MQIEYARAEIRPEATADRKLARFIVSTGAEDRSRRRVNQAGWELSAYKANPVVLWDHGFETAVPIATASAVGVKDGRLEATADFTETAAADPFADKIWRLVAAGVIRGASAGWRPLERPKSRFDAEGDYEGSEHTRQELVEFSIVNVPSNPQTLRIAKLLPGFHDQDLELIFGEKRNAGVTAGLERARDRIDVLRARVGVLSLSTRSTTP